MFFLFVLEMYQYVLKSQLNYNFVSYIKALPTKAVLLCKREENFLRALSKQRFANVSRGKRVDRGSVLRKSLFKVTIGPGQGCCIYLIGTLLKEGALNNPPIGRNVKPHNFTPLNHFYFDSDSIILNKFF